MVNLHSIRIRHHRQASHGHSLQQQLESAAQAGSDGVVANLLDGASPVDRQRALALDDVGADLALRLTSRAIQADHGRDAATLRAVLQPMTAADAPTGRGVRHEGLLLLGRHRRVTDKLVQAARSVTLAALLPQFESSGLPHIARQSLLSGELPYTNFQRSFPQEALSAGELRDLYDAGRIPFPLYCRAPNVRHDELAAMALQNLMDQTLSFNSFTALGFTLQPAQVYAAVRAQAVTALEVLAILTAGAPADDGAMRALVRTYADDFILDGSVSFRDALPYLGFLRLDDVHLYVQAQRTDWGEWVACGQICHEDLVQGVHENFFVAQHAQQPSRHAFDLITQLFVQERIDAACAARLALPHWDPSKVFPSFLLQVITAFPALDALLQGLPLPAAPGSAQTMSFFKRAVAVWHLAHRPVVVAPVAQQQRVARTECIICSDEVEDESDLFKLPACSHPASMDIECFYAGLDANGGRQCPDTQCGRSLDPNEILDLRGIPEAEAAATNHVADFYYTLPNYHACPQEGCANAIEVGPGARRTLDCRCCGVTTHFEIPDDILARRIATMPRSQLENLRFLVAGAAAASIPPGISQEARPQRECYGCGIITSHTEACMHMTCPNPNHGTDPSIPVRTKNWHWVKGLYTNYDYEYGVQRYRPWTNSMLGDYGLYGDIAPGASEIDVVPTLQRNLAALQAQYERVHGSA